MIKKFAIEPTAITRWQDFRYVMEKLGFSEGRVLATFPKGWVRILMENLDELGEIDRMRFTEKLRVFKEDRMITSGIPFNADQSWRENVRDNLPEFHRVIIDASVDEHLPKKIVGKIDDLDEAFFDVPRDIRCLNTSDNLALPAALLLHQATEAALIDPYFQPDIKGCLLVLAKLTELARAGKRFDRFYLYIRADSVPKDRGQSGAIQFKRICQTGMLDGLTFVFRVVDRRSGDGFHARYLLTKHGGLRYDKGFRAEVDPEMVDISILDRAIHAELRERYLASRPMPSVVDDWNWTF